MSVIGNLKGKEDAYIVLRRTKRQTKGEHRDREKGKHFIRCREIIKGRGNEVCKRRDAKEADAAPSARGSSEVKNAAFCDKGEHPLSPERNESRVINIICTRVQVPFACVNGDAARPEKKNCPI